MAGSALDRAAVKAAVLDYFQGSQLKDRARLERAFDLEVAMMTGPNNAATASETFKMADLIDPFVSGEPDMVAAEDYEFLDMEIVDGRMATVVFRSSEQWIDALTLLNTDGQWEIASKVYIPQD